jgi:hypothetical protein
LKKKNSIMQLTVYQSVFSVDNMYYTVVKSDSVNIER